MDHRSDENGYTISLAADFAAITEDTKTTVFFIDQDGEVASLFSGPKDTVEVAANATTLWTPKKLQVSGKAVKASKTIKSLGAVVWGGDEKKEVRVYFASAENILSEVCQTLIWNKTTKTWEDEDSNRPWRLGFLGRKSDNTSRGYPPPVHPTLAATSSISAAAIGVSNPPQVEILFTEKDNADKIACIYSYSDPKYPLVWAWATKYVGDKPADSTIFIEKEKQIPAPEPPRPEPQPAPPQPTPPQPAPQPMPRPPPVRPAPRERDCTSYIIFGTGFGFILGFVMGIVLYEPFGNSRGRPSLWK